MLAFFDFDGTITTKDSLADFIRFAAGRFHFYKGLLLLSPMLLSYKLGVIPNTDAKERLISHFFKGWDAAEFQKVADDYSKNRLDKIVLPQALEKISWHQRQGHKVVIVSASMDSWLMAWCRKYRLDLISTRLEIKNRKLTGKFATKNCHGMEKVKRIKREFNLSEFDTIYAYGNSRGDKEMLAIATQPHYRPFG